MEIPTLVFSFHGVFFRSLWDTWVKEVASTSLLLFWRNEKREERKGRREKKRDARRVGSNAHTEPEEPGGERFCYPVAVLSPLDGGRSVLPRSWSRTAVVSPGNVFSLVPYLARARGGAEQGHLVCALHERRATRVRPLAAAAGDPDDASRDPGSNTAAAKRRHCDQVCAIYSVL